MILILVVIDALHVRAWFGVVKNIAVDVFLNTSFIDSCIRRIIPSERKIVPWPSHQLSILPSFSTVCLLFSEISILSVHYAHAVKSSDANIDKEGEGFHLCRISRQIMTPSFIQAVISVICYGQGLLLMEIHPTFVRRRWSMSTWGVMEILSGMLFYIYAANLLAKAVNLSKQMIVVLTTTALQHFIQARRDEPDAEDSPRFDSTSHADGNWMETNNVILPR